MVTRAELNKLIQQITVVDETNEPEEKAPKAARVPRRSPTKRSDFAGNGHWMFEEELGQNGQFGFIYVIRDCIDGRCYIGKKQFLGSGKANKGVVSNWQWYVSSSKELSKKIIEHGRDNFEFIVLEQYMNRGTLGYAETWSLMRAETPTNRDKWYNMLVNKISWPVKEAITGRHKNRLDLIINEQPIIELGLVHA
jgi:Putative endonuclease segE, GIY-YIG domain